MGELSHSYTLLDVFTDTPLTGNPLAVFTAGELIPSRLMQALARELNLSETVFLLPGDGEADASVRIFTPRTELPFAGHPVLGAAFVMARERKLDTVRLRTGSGIVPVALTREHGEIVHGEMQQPVPAVAPYAQAEALLAALGLSRSCVALPVEAYTNGPTHVMVALADPDGSDPDGADASAGALSALDPDMGALGALGAIGVCCFLRLGAERVRSRVFAPGLGVAEDPATGSAAGPLALHMARHGWCAPATTLTIEQGLELARPSRLSACAHGDPQSPERITVGGGAAVVAQGNFRLQ